MAERSATNPYPGPRPFVAGENLYGRDREVTKLFYLLSAERIVVLHSPSGAGKSSLLNAGLVPMLRGERFYPWPTIRLSQPAANGGNRFVGSAIASLEEGLPESLRRPVEELAGETLAGYIAGRPRRPGAPASVVLLFDQFEEILTLDPLDLDARREFFRQLGEALENPEVWALFALREDYLGALDPYRDDLPTRLGNTFRVDLLTVEDARDAISKPARDAGREFAPDAALQLANDLATISVQQPDGSFEEKPGSHVEPLQLQVVCRRLWDRLPSDAHTIGVENLLASGDVDAALAAYYDGSVADIAGSDVPTERGLREWFSDRLITPGGIRGQVLREQTSSGGLDNDSVDRLVATHLVRAEERDGKTWFELAHDRLVGPVRDSNDAWLEDRLHPMQRQAALWQREERPENLLLRGQELKDAEAWARDNDSLRQVEKDLLSLSAKQRRAEQRRRRTLIAIGIGLLALVALLSALVGWALVQRSDANRATASATSLALASAANDQLDSRPDIALLLGLEANRARSSAQARNSVISALERARQPGAVAILRGHNGAVVNVAFSRDGSTLASAGADGAIRLWDVASHRQLGEPLGGGGVPVESVAFSRDGSTLASVSADGAIRLWDVATHRQLRQLGPAFTYNAGAPGSSPYGNAVAFSADGHILASASAGRVQLWNATTHGQLGRPLFVYTVPLLESKYNPGAVPLVSLAFSPHGHTIAAAGEDGKVRRWSVTTERRRRLGQPIRGPSTDVPSVALSPNGHTLASISNVGVQLWDTTTHGPLGRPLPGAFKSVAFSHKGRILASAGDDGTVRLWDVATRRQHGQPLRGHTGAVSTVAFSPDGHTLASAGADGTVRLWNFTADRQRLRPLRPTGGYFSSTSLSPDTHILATAGWDGIRLWSLTTRRQIGRPLSGRDSTSSTVAFSADGDTLASTSGDGIQLWDVAAHKRKGRPFGGHTGNVSSVAFSPDKDEHILASVSSDRIRLWDFTTGRQLGKALPGRTGSLPSISFSPDGDTLASASGDSIQLWDVTTRRQLGKPLPGASPIAFSPDGHTLASASPDGQTLASAGDDGIKLWDVATGRQLGQPLHAAKPVESVAFSPDGHTLVTSAGGVVQLWDVATHQQLGQAIDGSVDAIAFTPDGRTLAFANEERTVGFWKEILWSGFDDLRTQVCDLVWGNLTPAEWERYAPGLSYRTSCAG